MTIHRSSDLHPYLQSGAGTPTVIDGLGGDEFIADDLEVGDKIFVGDGAVGTPSLSFVSDPDTGMYNYAANTIGLATNGAVGLALTTAQVLSYTGGAGSPTYGFLNDVNTGMYSGGADILNFTAGGNRVTTMGRDGMNIAQQAQTTGTPSALVVTAAANTGVTAATECIGVDFDLSATKTWAAGAGPLAEQSEVLIDAPTYAGDAGGALTITEASTFTITGAPTAGANMTLTNAYSLWTAAGSINHTLGATDKVYIDGATTDQAHTNGALKVDVDANITASSGINLTSAMKIDDIDYIGIKSTILGLAAGHTSDNEIAAFTADVAGSSNDTDIEIVSFKAANANKNGGASSMVAFATGTGYDDLIAADSGDIGFISYTPVFYYEEDAAVTAATELSLLNFGDGGTKTWAAGAGPLAAQREFQFVAPTYAGNAGGALTITDAATVYIDAAPTQGANMTLTNSWALWVDSGPTRIDDFLWINGGQGVNRTDAGAANYNPSAQTSDYLITADNTAAPRNIIISTEDVTNSNTSAPRTFVIKDEYGNATAQNLTITLENGGTIDGAANAVISGNYDSLTIYVDGTNAYII